MRIQSFLTFVLALCLTACATSTERAEKPATDLQVLQLGIEAILSPRSIAGPYQHLDEAPTVGAGLDFGADAEEAHWLSEHDKARGIEFRKGMFPWAASGRALAQAREEGFTKLLFDPATNRVLGGGLVGPNAGELVAEIALAIEMGADAADISMTIHPHPTLSETVAFSAEAFEGTLTDLYIPRKK